MQTKDRPCRRPQDLGGFGIGRPLSEHHRLHAQGRGRPHERADIARILDPLERHDPIAAAEDLCLWPEREPSPDAHHLLRRAHLGDAREGFRPEHVDRAARTAGRPALVRRFIAHVDFDQGAGEQGLLHEVRAFEQDQALFRADLGLIEPREPLLALATGWGGWLVLRALGFHSASMRRPRDLSRPVEEVQFVVQPDDDGLRLDLWIAARVTWRSRSDLVKRIEDGRILLDGRRARKSERLHAGQVVRVIVDAGPALDAIPLDRLPIQLSDA